MSDVRKIIDLDRLSRFKDDMDQEVAGQTPAISGNKLTIGGSATPIAQDIVNVNDINGVPTTAYGSAAAARAAVDASSGLRIQGQIITYLLADGWYTDQYIGSATDNTSWGTPSNWKTLGPVSVSQNTLSIGSEEVGELAGQLIENPEWIWVVNTATQQILLGFHKKDGSPFFGYGCPPQVKDYINDFIDENFGDYDSIRKFLGDLVNGNTLTELLNQKVDKVTGKSLIDKDFADGIKFIESPEFIWVVTTHDNKVLLGIRRTNGDTIFGNGVPPQIISYVTALLVDKVDKVEGKSLINKIYAKCVDVIDNPQYMDVELDNNKKLVSYRDTEGVKHEEVGFEAGFVHTDLLSAQEIKLDGQSISDSLKRVDENLRLPVISMPDKVYVLADTTMQLFKSQLAPVHNPENYELRIELISQAVSKDWGKNFDVLYEYPVDMTDTDFILKFGLYNDILGLTMCKNSTQFIHVPKASSPASVKNVLCIGDSFTDADIWVSELRRLLTGVVSPGYSDSSDSDIVADTLSNINFIGTQDTEEGKTPNEGYYGEDYQFFAGAGGMVHTGKGPFVNPNTNEIDFDYYMSTGNVKGTIENPTSGSLIDYVIILLGTNQHHAPQYIKAVWDALLTHNPNVKVIICGQCFAIPYGADTPIRDRKTYVRLSEMAQQTNKLLRWLCSSGVYSNNFLWCDYNVLFDSFNNMRYKLVYPNIRNKDNDAKIRRTDTGDDVHPVKSGYFQIADAIRPAFHYWFLNNN